MTTDECLLNIIKGADYADDEDVALRHTLVLMLREHGFGPLLVAVLHGDHAMAA
jgi:hypothetical protein